jgi:glycosyltransferase involved in cell wall biosynthesis
MVRVCRAMMDAGLDFHWYVAGEGPDRALIEADIAAAKVGARMTLLGQLNNPYPAYRAADVVAMLSYFEGLCGVINEARVLERPVIATQVSGVDEQLIDGVNGLIVPQEERQIVAGMKRILTDAGLRARLAQGGYSEALLDDDAKMDRIEALFLGKRTRS